MPTIPSGLIPESTGYTIGPPGGVWMVEVGGGMPRTGLDYDRGEQHHQVAIVCTETELLMWTLFYVHETKEGTVAFDMPLDSGWGVQTHSVRVVPGSYAAERVAGDKTRVSFTAATTSAAYDLSEAEALALIAAFDAANPGATLVDRLKPMVRAYGFEGSDAPFSSDVSAAVPGYARPWERGVQTFRVTLRMNSEVFQVWTAYLHHVLRKGAVGFQMTLDSGLGASLHLVQMVPGTYSVARPTGPTYYVSFAVKAQGEVYTISSADSAAMIALFNEFGNDLGPLLERLAQFANEDMLVLQS